jgi:hypothetical protein
MNDRIKELVKQAGLDDDMFPIEEWDNPELEKFAELIIRECGNYLMSDEFIGRSDLDWGMVLNEHFGVK